MPADSLDKSRLKGVLIGGGLAYSGSMVGLNELWYADFPRSKFHFYGDHDHWLQLDKMGHVLSGYQLGKLGKDLLTWSGVKHEKAVLYGGNLGTLVLTSTEMLDGFSAQWGFSSSDAFSNIVGAGLYIGQEMGWREQRIRMKFSTHLTRYAQYRPDLLGQNTIERWMKDYNGHTYWLSANMHSLLDGHPDIGPKWLNLAFGMGGRGMLTGDPDDPLAEKITGEPPRFDLHRQYYLSLDLDLTRIPVDSPFLNTLFDALGFIKFPAPALEYNQKNGIRGHFLFF